jgi:hypothetical protein
VTTPSLSILVRRRRKMESELWRKSELLLSAKEEISVVNRRGYAWRCHKLQWLQ